MFKKLLLFYMIVISCKSCKEGCLKCEENACVICDFLNGYLLDIDKTCKKMPSANCEYTDLNGRCLQCSEGYYKDIVTSNCVKAETSIENCKYYKSSSSCQSCQKGFVMVSIKCLPVEKLIPGCLTYVTETICSECETGYVKEMNGLGCNKVDIGDCSLYGFVHCNTCLNGFTKNKSFYIDYFIQNNSNLNTMMTLSKMNNNTSFKVNVCQKNILENCINFETYNKCKICASGYFLDENKVCVLFPKEEIENCQVYSSLTECTKCITGYHLTELSLCTLDEIIPNCKLYNPEAETTECLECTEKFYLNGASCLERTNESIINCKDYSLNADKCETCKETFRVTSDGLKCLTSIKNCMTYQSSSNSDESFVCQKCINEHYLSENICVKGTQPNCEVYQASSDECAKCKKEYYLNSNLICVLHKKITSCVEYSSNTADQCRACNNTSILFEIESMCKITQEIEGCFSYLSLDECDVCKEGYFKSGKLCSKIDSKLKCLVFKNDNCTKCEPGYILDAGKCLIPISYISGNCLKNNLESGTIGRNEAICSICAENSVPFDFYNYFLCFEEVWINQLIPNPIQNCEKYEYDQVAARYKCSKCQKGYFTQNGICNNTCTEKMNYRLTTVGTDMSISSVFTCGGTTVVTNCAEYSTLVKNNENNNHPKCIKCKPDHIPVIYPITNVNKDKSAPYQKIDFDDNNGLPISPVSYFPIVHECVSNSDVQVIIVPFCEYYIKFTVNSVHNYRCVRCIHGKTGELKDQDSFTYIRECINMDCTSLKYPGLEPELNAMISCHECSSDKIPILFGKGGSPYSTITSLKSYDLKIAGVGNWKTVTQGGNSVGCHSTKDVNLGIADLNLPINCAIGFMNLDSQLIQDETEISGIDANKLYLVNLRKIAVMCIACKRGKKRIYGATTAQNAASPQYIKYMVAECQDIPNCVNSTWLNYCSECSPDSCYLYVANVGVDYSVCTDIQRELNCFAAEIVNGDKVCRFCKKGYSKNYDGICEEMIPPKCSTFSYNFTFKFYDFNTALFLMPEGPGCNDCEIGYTGVKMFQSTFACTPSLYMLTIAKENTNYISNCSYYFKQGADLKCRKCKANYVVSSDNSKCFKDTLIAKCLFAESETNCLICEDFFIALSYRCVLKDIKNCDIYSDDPSLLDQTCIECEKGFFLDNNTCMFGNIPNCKRYENSEQNCVECNEGYMIVVDKNGNKYCYLIEPRLQCAELDQTKFQNQILNCKKCTIGLPLYYTTENIDDNMCSSFSFVSNCLQYEKYSSFGDSTFYCSKCDTNYWADKFSCNLRKVKDDNCLEYKKNADECLVCKDDYFVYKNGYCMKNPFGIFGCETYSNNTTCISCKKAMYLTANKCMAILPKETIPNCLYYEDSQSCRKCDSQYFLNEKKCEKAQAQNCLTYESLKKCKTCQNGWGLKEIDGMLSCTKPTDANCTDFIPVFPFICNRCVKDYYPNEEGKCVKVTKIIPNCEIYDGPDTCFACKKTYVLSPEYEKCEKNSYNSSFVDDNCLITTSTEDPVCTICQPGYFMAINGKCELCAVEGCLFCDPEVINRCLICKSGFYMNATFQCSSFNIDGNPKDNDNSNQTDKPTNPDIKEFLSLRKTVFLIFLLL